jgi:hypothetical protein
MASSIATVSPSFFIQRDKVTSVIDSPTGGTFISDVLAASEGFTVAAGCAVVSAVALTAGALSFAVAGSAGAAAAPLPSSIRATVAPMANVSPSLAKVFKVQAFSAVSSKVALSDSNSAITSSILTTSPSFFNHDDRVTSVIDSPTGGTLISKLMFVIGYALRVSGCELQVNIYNSQPVIRNKNINLHWP